MELTTSPQPKPEVAPTPAAVPGAGGAADAAAAATRVNAAAPDTEHQPPAPAPPGQPAAPGTPGAGPANTSGTPIAPSDPAGTPGTPTPGTAAIIKTPTGSTDPVTLVANTTPKQKRGRGHTRQRSASWSAADAIKFVEAGAEGAQPRARTKSPPPLFAGVAPSNSRSDLDSDGRRVSHSYTPRKPVQGIASASNVDLLRLGASRLGVPRMRSLDSGGKRKSLPQLKRREEANTTKPIYDPDDPELEGVKGVVSPEGATDDDSPEDKVLAERRLASAFLKSICCYDMVPESGKIVVFDTQLLVKKAFFALVQHHLRAGLLWDSSAQQYIGMITITDFIHILRKYYVSPLVQIDELEDHKIQTWRDITDSHRPRVLLSIDPTASLFDATQMLLTEKIHRLPVIDNESGNALSILTLKRILWYMRSVFPWTELPVLMSMTVKELNIGCTKNVAAVSPDTPLISVLNIFVERNISALPIIDDTGKVIDIYVKYDAINLAETRTYNNLDIAVTKALKHRDQARRSLAVADSGPQGVQTCMLEDTLQDVLDKIFAADVTRLIIVDKATRLIGILSLSDILAVFLATA